MKLMLWKESTIGGSNRAPGGVLRIYWDREWERNLDRRFCLLNFSLANVSYTTGILISVAMKQAMFPFGRY